MPGPLPTENPRRRNDPTIPTTNLPAAGFTGRAPKVPTAYVLGEAGRAWWRWAWKTPQAAAWDHGSLYALARRAQLEDELVALGTDPESTIADILASAIDADGDPDEMRRVAQALDWLISTLQKRAGGSGAVMREMRELDDRFGLTAKGRAALRWKIVAEKEEKAATTSKTKPGAAARAAAAGLAAVDPLT